jgi:hypothetical protein
MILWSAARVVWKPGWTSPLGPKFARPNIILVMADDQGWGSVCLVDDAIAFLKKHKDGERPIFTVVWFPSPHDPHGEVHRCGVRWPNPGGVPTPLWIGGGV